MKTSMNYYYFNCIDKIHYIQLYSLIKRIIDMFNKSLIHTVICIQIFLLHTYVDIIFFFFFIIYILLFSNVSFSFFFFFIY